MRLFQDESVGSELSVRVNYLEELERKDRDVQKHTRDLKFDMNYI